MLNEWMLDVCAHLTFMAIIVVIIPQKKNNHLSPKGMSSLPGAWFGWGRSAVVREMGYWGWSWRCSSHSIRDGSQGRSATISPSPYGESGQSVSCLGSQSPPFAGENNLLRFGIRSTSWHRLDESICSYGEFISWTWMTFLCNEIILLRRFLCVYICAFDWMITCQWLQ